MSLLSFLPSILGVVGSLFGGKGNKTQYAAQQTPQQSAAYNSLLQLLTRQAGQGSAGYQPTSDALSLLYNTFLPGQNYTASSGAYTFPGTSTSVTPSSLRQTRTSRR